MTIATTFWENFFLLLLFLPLLMVWAFALIDIFARDDMSGGKKALWVFAVIVLPFLGTFIYLATRRPGPRREEQTVMAEAGRSFQAASPVPLAELQVLADLHDRGKLTDEEFAAEKARIFGATSTVPV